MEVNRVFCRDCLEGMREMPDSCVDLVVTDPPYYISALKEDLSAETLRKSGSIFCASWDNFDSLEGYKGFISDVLDELGRVLKPKAQVYMFFSYHHIHWGREMIERKGFKFYKFLIWYKSDTMGVFPNQYGCNYEPILWFRKQGDEGRVKLNIGCSQRDVFDVPTTRISDRVDAGFHPTCKPKKIIRQLIINGSDFGDLVLDPFMGSGTTAVCCKETGRDFVGFEKNPDYCLIIEKRLKQENLLSTLEVFDEKKEC